MLWAYDLLKIETIKIISFSLSSYLMFDIFR